MIAHLKDQLQEMKAKTSMEGKYIKKEAEVRVLCTQKKCQQSENMLKEDYQVNIVVIHILLYRLQLQSFSSYQWY